jgi:hypothetical protein
MGPADSYTIQYIMRLWKLIDTASGAVKTRFTRNESTGGSRPGLEDR